MSENLEEDNDEMISFLVSELCSSTSSPSYEYMKTNLLSSGNDVLHILACAAKESVNIDLTPVANVNNKFDDFLNSDDSLFNQAFKLEKQTVKDLITVLEGRCKNNLEESSTSVTEKTLLTCWLLTTNEGYPSASDSFLIPEENVEKYFLDVCSEISKLVGLYVTWPTTSECNMISEWFETQFGFPGVVGVISNSSLTVNKPFIDLRRKKYVGDVYYVNMQIVCDHRFVIRDLCIDFSPNKKTASEILCESPLYNNLLKRNEPLIEAKKYILGGSEYPQLTNLLTPYSSEARNRPLNKDETDFNLLHSATRSVIDKCIKMLTTRFLRLNCIDVQHPSSASAVVLAACVLHNFALSRNDEFQVCAENNLESIEV